MNAALTAEETKRNYKDKKAPLVLVALDAKSAFDVTMHKTLMQGLYLCGVNDKHWSLVNSLHTGATSPSGTRGSPGGVLSAELYKSFVDPHTTYFCQYQSKDRSENRAYTLCCPYMC